MNKGELIEAMAERAGLDKRQAEGALNAFVDAVMESTKRGERVAILGFGSFNPTSRGARIGRNPQTGDPVKIAASKGVRFGPGAAFKATLNSKAQPKKASAKKATAAKKAAPTKKAASTSKSAAVQKAPAKKSSRSTKSTKK